MDQNQTPPRRKLIEASIPLEKINTESRREKSIRTGHPSTVHQWWSRKPTAAARAVLFAQIIDDPSTRPDLFPTQEAQEAERRELFTLIEKLSKWESVTARDSDNPLIEAKKRIRLYTGDDLPIIADPFAGGGSIPLEAQRLGLPATASDLNPVAVLLEKALLEIPSRFANRPPISIATEALFDKKQTWTGSKGLAEDILFFGQSLLEKAKSELSDLYPEVQLNDGTKVPAIAWLWVRTTTCPNPACGVAAPLTSSWYLTKKKGKEKFLHPIIQDRKISYKICDGLKNVPDGTVNRSGAKCINCGSAISLQHIRDEGQAGKLGHDLTAIVADTSSGRSYFAPSKSDEDAAFVSLPEDLPPGEIPDKALGFRVKPYGFNNYSDLFSPRQLVALSTLSGLVEDLKKQIVSVGSNSEWEDLDSYADAVVTILAICISKLANNSSALTTWMKDRGAFREVFSRQALPMYWDYAENNPLGPHGGALEENISKVATAVAAAPIASSFCVPVNQDALKSDLSGKVISTDPPYYDYVGYSDLSDFFYIWLRRSLRHIYPQLFNRVLVPKNDELVANPYRHNGEQGAQEYFETGFVKFFEHARQHASVTYPMTVYYAFKQQDAKSATLSGWETVLEGMIKSGWQITATWPMRTESPGRVLANGTNALASSILLVLRQRPENAPLITRSDFLSELKEALPAALKDLQKGTISPVDLPQSAIGPGMKIFSKYNGVYESDGHKMTVRSALSIINEILDEVLSEQEGDYDSDTRFAIAWFRTYGFNSSIYGNADSLARARNTSIDHLVRSGILDSGRGEVHLLSPADLYEADQGQSPYDPSSDNSVSAWETVLHLAKELDFGNGVEGAGILLSQVPPQIDRELCKQLAFLLFSIAESLNESKTALLFNQLGTSWNDIEEAARKSSASKFSTPETLF